MPQELQATFNAVRIPFIPIIEKGLSPHSMVKDFAELDYFFYPPLEFNGVDELLAQLPEKAIAPAQAYLERRQAKLKAIFGE